MSTNVALMSLSLVSGASPFSSSTHSPISRAKTNETPPRRPECHIMKRCAGEIMIFRSAGRRLATTRLMTLDTMPMGTTATKRPTRQKPMTHMLRCRPWPPRSTTKTPWTPQNMKISVSASEEVCRSRKEAMDMLSADRCPLANWPMKME